MKSLGDAAQRLLRDRYQIQQQLGKKAGRQTFLAIDNATQQSVVIKLLSFSKDFEWDDLKLFEREAETLKSLNHPAIPRYLDFFEVDLPHSKGFSLVQSYIPAKSLEAHLKAGRRFSEPEVKQLAIALLEILSYLHSQQPPVIHRDIKPSNILLGERSGNSVGQVYLVDFGSVQSLAATEGSTTTVVGTYGYMPPEQFGGRAVPASDLYSLGATLIYLATGKHPAELPQVELRLQFRKLANLSPHILDWLQWMVEPSLNNRPTSAKTATTYLLKPGKLAFPANLHNQNDVSSLNSANFYLNAFKRGISAGMLAHLLDTAIYFATYPSFASPPFSLVNLIFQLVAVGGVTGSLNAFLWVWVTNRLASRSQLRRYRGWLAVGSLVVTSIILLITLAFGSPVAYNRLYAMLTQWRTLLSAGIHWICMVGGSQWFASWYLSERKKALRQSR